MIGSYHGLRAKSPLGTVLIINLLVKGLTPRACVGDGGSIWWAPECIYCIVVSLLLFIGQVSTNYRRSVGETSAKCQWTKSGTTIDRVSTECRPTIDRISTAISTDCRPSVDQVSTECRPSIDRLSTECRPTIDWVSTTISTDISVDITRSKQDPTNLVFVICLQLPPPRLVHKLFPVGKVM